MELCLKKKIPLLLFAACIFFTVVLTETISATEHDHACIGLNCPICLIIEIGHNLLKTLKFTGFMLFAVLLMFFAHILKRYVWFYVYHFSPVTLKVRFIS